MADYIDREALLLRIDCHGTNRFGMLDEDIRAFVKAQPTVDAVPVVRCEKCKHPSVWNGKDIYAVCPKTNTVFLPFGLDTRTHFCSYGDRRTDENQRN